MFRQSGSAPARFGPGRFETYGCYSLLEFNNQKLSRYLAQYDMTEMLRRYGLCSPHGDLIGGSYLLSLMRSARGGRGRGALSLMFGLRAAALAIPHQRFLVIAA